MLYIGCNYFSMPGFKLIHVSEMSNMERQANPVFIYIFVVQIHYHLLQMV